GEGLLDQVIDEHGAHYDRPAVAGLPRHMPGYGLATLSGQLRGKRVLEQRVAALRFPRPIGCHPLRGIRDTRNQRLGGIRHSPLRYFIFTAGAAAGRGWRQTGRDYCWLPPLVRGTVPLA